MEAAATAMGKMFAGSGKETKKDVPDAAPTSETATKTSTIDGDAVAADVVDSSSGQKDVEVEQGVAPAVEHETVTREHETREQTVVDREKHQHHYHTTVQPLKDREVQAEVHDDQVAPTKHREISEDTNGATVRAGVGERESAFTNTTEEGVQKETTTDEGTVVGEQVHHHLHETIQPVIEKETVKPSVTHKTIPVKEVIQKESQDHGVTEKAPMSVDEFQHRLDGEGPSDTAKYSGKPTMSSDTAVTSKDQ